MITPKERSEKIRKAPSNSTRFFRAVTSDQRKEHAHQAMEHANDAGMSSTDEYVFLKTREVAGK